MLSTTMSTKALPLHLSLLFLLLLLGCSCVSGASLRDHRLRGAEGDSAGPDQDMLKALEYIQSLRRQNSENPRPASKPAGEEAQAGRREEEEGREEDKSEELLQAVLSTLQQTEKETPKAQSITPHKKLPLMFDEEEEGDEGDADEFDPGSPFKRTNENVEEKYTPQNLATLQSVFEELGKLTNPKRGDGENAREENEEGEMFNAREAAYDEGDWERQAEEERSEVERALDYLQDNEEVSRDDERFDKRSTDQDPDDEANLADFYLLKVLEQTEEEEQKRALEEEEEEEEQERKARRVGEYRNSVDPRLLYQLLQISQKYGIPPEDLIDMLKGGELSNRKNSIKVSPIYSRKLYRKPDFYNRRQKSQEELRKERILKILGLSGDENSAQSPFRKQYKNSPSRLYARPTWRSGDPTPLAKSQTQQRLPTKLKDDYDDTENELATFLAARMLSKYPTYVKSKTGQKRDQEEEEEEEEQGRSQSEFFERAVQDYFDQLDSDRNEEKRQLEEDDRGVEGFDNDAVMKLLSFVTPETEEAKAAQ